MLQREAPSCLQSMCWVERDGRSRLSIAGVASNIVEQSFPTRRELKDEWIRISERAFCASAGQSPSRKISLGILEYGIDLEMSAGMSRFV
jgi:hypothetical protein